MSTLDGTTMHPDVVLKNEGSMMQTFRSMNVCVINKDSYMLLKFQC